MRHLQYSRRRRPGALQRPLIVLATILLVVVPIGFRELPREVARWYRAASADAELNQDYGTAIDRLNSAIAWTETDPDLYRERAWLKLGLRQWDSGLADCDRAWELAPDDQGVRVVRANLLMGLGRHEEAIAEFRRVVEQRAQEVPQQRARALNGLAYACAVGNCELDAGLQAIDQALDITATRIGELDPMGYLCFHRAATCIKQERDEAALASLHQAVQFAEARYRRAAAQAEIMKRLPPGLFSPPGYVEFAERASLLKTHLAGILHVRVGLLQDLERADEAAEDQQRLEELSPQGNLIVAKPAGFVAAANQLLQTGNMLDTRGFLHYRRGDLVAARRDMYTAVAIIDALTETFDWQVDATKHLLVDIRPLTNEYRSLLQSKAVIYYHQMLVHEALGNETKAAADRSQVRKLGYEPGPHLF
jgi:tetratricopeptide (TPR) repeat protein